MEWKGIDVSRWQGEIAWNKVKDDGVSFAMIRTGAADRMDPKFKANIEGALSAGLKCGVYHYSAADTPDEARREAELVLNALKPYKITYPVAFDIEDRVQSQLTNYLRTSLAEAFCKAVSGEKYHAAIYSSLYWFQNLLDLGRLEAFDKWVAQWETKECSYTGELKIWQHTNKGKVNGIEGYVDLNIAYDDYQEKASPLPPVKQEKPVAKPAVIQPSDTSWKAGSILILKGIPQYLSSTAKKSTGKLTGKYWIYDGIVINGRIRVTNTREKVGKTPVSENVTSYIAINDVNK